MTKTKRMKIMFYVILPIIFTILVYITTFVIFDQNRKQTINVMTENISNELDNAIFTAYKLDYTSTDGHLSAEQLIALASNVRSINEQSNSYCFLFDVNFEWGQNFVDVTTKPDKNTVRIVQALIDNNFAETIQEQDNQIVDDNYIHLTIDNKKYVFYWRKAPPVDSEVYIIVGLCEDDVEPNKIINICRFLIGTMDIFVVGCIYTIVYVYYEKPKRIGGS